MKHEELLEKSETAKTTKIAYIVSICPMARVVIDTEGKTDAQIQEEAIKLAIKKMRRSILDYLNEENCEEVFIDAECPAQPDEELTANTLK